MRAAAIVEVAAERVFFQGNLEKLSIEPYGGYATTEHLIARGRVLAAREIEKIDGQSKLANARQMFRLFATHEVAEVTVRSGSCSAVTDAEGYFTLLTPRGDQSGWVNVAVAIPGQSAICPVLVARRDARWAVISDIDDTMMHTGAWSTLRNLWTSFTGSVASREVFDDAVALIRGLAADGRNPVYFVSSSPWNFHGFLDDVFRRAGLPEAPKFLRDYGFGDDQFITGRHGDHKGSAIDRIAAAHPDLPLVLIGDTGQHDAKIYADAAVRHPGRVARVILRTPGGGADADDRLQAERLRSLGIPVSLDTNFHAALAELSSTGPSGV
ncbi:phosphatase domain-containing protein [Loktanella sp. DJP18]|uniref:phosphatase domain-containing protein n=1 Tax=Loktanella sp. DJP18 TaxID=3409788 RepID=UPI003BB5B3B5